MTIPSSLKASYAKIYRGSSLTHTTQLKQVLDEFDVGYVDGTEPPLKECTVPAGGAMVGRCTLAAELVDADERVSWPR